MAINTLLNRLNQHFGPRAQVIAQGEPLTLEQGRVVANFFGMRLHTRFETLNGIHSGVLGRRAGFDAYNPQGRSISAWAPYAVALDEHTVAVLDRLIRTAQVLNASLFGIQQTLYLSVHPLHLREVSAGHGAAFAEILQRCGLQAQNVVLQFHELDGLEWSLVRRALASYQSYGFAIALQHSGGSVEALERLLDLRPNALLFGRGLLLNAELGERGVRVLRERAELARRRNVRTLLLGLTDHSQLELARRAGVDGYQGHFDQGLEFAQCARER